MSLLQELIGDLEEVRREVGPKPDEGLMEVRIASEGRVREGAGWKKGEEVLLATSGARTQYIGNLNRAEKEMLGVTRADAEYVVTLEAFTRVPGSAFLRESAPEWQAQSLYRGGSRIVEAGMMYQCTGDFSGQRPSGTGEPMWNIKEGSGTPDGELIWLCLGVPKEYQVIEVLGTSTFGEYISRRVLCKNRQL
jgi:hypothetical protein